MACSFPGFDQAENSSRIVFSRLEVVDSHRTPTAGIKQGLMGAAWRTTSGLNMPFIAWRALPSYLLLLLLAFDVEAFSRPSRSSQWIKPPLDPLQHEHLRRSINQNPNGSQFIWIPQDEYSGANFYEWVVPTFPSSQ